MAMVVQHNIGAQMALGELNKNVNKVGVLLGKISSGQKINSAKDDSANFCISEKMREMIRTLTQDHQNVQNGSSLFKIAEGGINSIVEELRNLKELAINSANDTNTDIDRLTIQKVFDQKKMNINDIATETDYNTKRLLDGSLGNSATAIYYSGGSRSGGSSSKSSSLTAGFTPLSGTKFWNPYTNQTQNPDHPHWVSGGGYPVTESYEGYPTSKVYADFSGYNISNVASSLNGGGFSIACGTCSQYVSIKFDGSIDASDSTVGQDSSNNPEYTIGIKNVGSMSNLARTIFEGVRAARTADGKTPGPDNNTATIDDSGHNITMYRDSATGKYIIEKSSNPLQFYGKGTYGGTPNPSPIPEEPKVVYGFDAPLKIHHGPHANQATTFFLNDMHTKSLGTKKLLDDGMPIDDGDLARYDALSYDENLQDEWLKTLEAAQNKTLDDIDVVTKKNANVAIRVIDSAIEYSLNEATRVGSYLQRLDYTDSNLVVMNENIQAAESSIRDADMAKEMTEYTKMNVLAQASQAMLAQANQNSSQVLSLLQ